MDIYTYIHIFIHTYIHSIYDIYIWIYLYIHKPSCKHPLWLDPLSLWSSSLTLLGTRGRCPSGPRTLCFSSGFLSLCSSSLPLRFPPSSERKQTHMHGRHRSENNVVTIYGFNAGVQGEMWRVRLAGCGPGSWTWPPAVLVLLWERHLVEPELCC